MQAARCVCNVFAIWLPFSQPQVSQLSRLFWCAASRPACRGCGGGGCGLQLRGGEDRELQGGRHPQCPRGHSHAGGARGAPGGGAAVPRDREAPGLLGG
eukprot:scaffold274465_cov40-Prasinocladus_malaysianus.AAC.1